MNYKKTITTVIMALILGNQIYAQQMLWKVKGNFGGYVYLLGSIHMGKESMYPLSREINTAFNDSDYVVLETKLDTEATLVMQKAMFASGRLEKNDTIENYISEELYALLKEQLNRYKLPKNSMDTFKPWVAALVLANQEIIHLGYSTVFGIDQHFWHRSIEQNKPVYSLEGAVMQANIFMQESPKFNEQLLQMQLDTLQTKDEAEQMVTMWQEGNDSYFTGELLNSFELYPEVKKILLTKRNSYMLDRIERYRNNSKGQSYFVIVGTAHLIGKEGIIAKLEAMDANISRY